MDPTLIVSRRIDDIKKSFSRLLKISKVEDLTFRDLRKFFNHLLVSRYGLSTKEASSYIGNSQVVNLRNYDPVSPSVILSKTSSLPLSRMIGHDGLNLVN